MEKLEQLYSKLPDLRLLGEAGIRFTMGEGYILHNKEVLDELLNEWCIEAKKVYGDWDGLFDRRPVNTMGMIGRIVSDSSPTRLSEIWGRICNIDPSRKEWGQMYYALNEGSGDDVCLNKYFRDQRLDLILD